MKELIYYTTTTSPIGTLILCSSLKGLISIDFLINLSETDVICNISSKFICEKVNNDHKIFISPVKELSDYFLGNLKYFSIALDIRGTNFQKSVWKSLINIPYGETVSYSSIAKLIGNEKASRAIGQANNKNPIPIIIPCHRVIGKNGKLVGYSEGLSIKKWLLDHEVIFKYK